jgi:hypothetical protein
VQRHFPEYLLHGNSYKLTLSLLHPDAVVHTASASLAFNVTAVIQAVCAQSQKVKDGRFKTTFFLMGRQVSQLCELVFRGSFLLRYAAPKFFTLKSYSLNALTSSSMEHSDKFQGKTNKASYSRVDFANADVFKNANRLVLRLYLPSLGLGRSLYSTAQLHPHWSVSYTYSIFGSTRTSRNEWPPLDTLLPLHHRTPLHTTE